MEIMNTDHILDMSKVDSFNVLMEKLIVKFAGQKVLNSLNDATNVFTLLMVRMCFCFEMVLSKHLKYMALGFF